MSTRGAAIALVPEEHNRNGEGFQAYRISPQSHSDGETARAKSIYAIEDQRQNIFVALSPINAFATIAANQVNA